jgi:hypothetical protein
MVWVSLARINPGDLLIQPSMNLGGLHRMCGKWIQKHHIFDSDRLYMCHDRCWNAWKGCLGMVFCANDEACNIFNKGLILPLSASCWCNQLLTSFIWILVLVNIYISGRIEWFKHLIGYLLGCQWHRFTFIILLRDNVTLLALQMRGFGQGKSQVSCRNSFSKCWCERTSWRPLGHCCPGRSLNWLVVRFWIDISMINDIFCNSAEIIIEIHVAGRSSVSPSAGRKRRTRRVAPSFHDWKRWQVINTKN